MFKKYYNCHISKSDICCSILWIIIKCTIPDLLYENKDVMMLIESRTNPGKQ